MATHPEPTPSLFRVPLRLLLVAIALLAVLLELSVPTLKRTLFPETWNTWIVKTVKRSDGAVVRLRIRRYPDRDAVFEEVITPPSAARTEHSKNAGSTHSRDESS